MEYHRNNHHFDARDLLTKKTYGTSGIQTFTWDSMRRKTQDTDNNSALQTVTCDYLFDKLHRITSQSQTIGGGTTQTVSKLYDAFGHSTRVSMPKTYGFRTTKGKIKWVPKLKVGGNGNIGEVFAIPPILNDPNTGFGGVNQALFSGALTSTVNRPNFWNTINTTEVDGLREVKQIRDCCCDQFVNLLQVRPKKE